jgi:hypothetical protein
LDTPLTGRVSKMVPLAKAGAQVQTIASAMAVQEKDRI